MRPKIVPELDVADLQRSLRFYTEVCGFRAAYERPAEGSPTSSGKGRS